MSNFLVLSNVIYHENKPLVNPYKKAYDEAFIPIIISTLSVKIYYADQLKGHYFPFVDMSEDNLLLSWITLNNLAWMKYNILKNVKEYIYLKTAHWLFGGG